MGILLSGKPYGFEHQFAQVCAERRLHRSERWIARQIAPLERIRLQVVQLVLIGVFDPMDVLIPGGTNRPVVHVHQMGKRLLVGIELDQDRLTPTRWRSLKKRHQ